MAVLSADPGSMSAIPAQLVRHLNLDVASVREAGTFVLENGSTLDVYTGARFDNAERCLITLAGGGAAGACSPNLFAQGPLYIGEAVADDRIRVVGIARPDVARIVLVDAANATHPVNLTEGRAFLWETTGEAIASAGAPRNMKVYDAAGRQIADMPVPQTANGG